MDGLQIFWAHEEGEEDSGEEDEEEGEDLETQLLTCASLRTDARQPPPLWLPPHEVREETTRRAGKPLSSAVELDGTLAASREALPRSGAAATSPYSSGPSVLPAEPRASSPLLASACSPFPRPLPLQSLSALRSLHFSGLPSHAASSPVSKYPATSVSPPSDPVPASTSAAADSRASFVDRQSRSVTPCSSATRADSTAALWRSKETDASAVPPGTACGLPSHLSSSWSTAAASSAPSAFPLSGSSSSSPSASPIRSLSCGTGFPSCSGSASSPASSAGSSLPLKTQTPSPCSQLFSLLDDLLEGGVLCEFNSPSPKKSPGLGGRLSSSFSSDASSATPSPVKALATPAVASPSRAPHAAAPWAASSGSSAASRSLAAAPVSSRPLTSPVSASRAAQTPSRGSQTRAAVSPSAAACCSPRAPLSAFDSAATPPMLSSPLASLSPSSLPRSSSVDAASRASAAASRQSDPPPPPPSVVAQAEKTGDLHAQACVDFELDDLDDVLSQPSACASVVSLHARAPGSSPHHATPRPSPASRADCLSSAAAQNIADESTMQKADPSDADAVAACRVGGGGWSGEGAQSPSLPPVARAAELAVDRKLFDSNPLGGNPSGSARSLCLPQASGHENSADIPRRFLAFFDDSLSFSLPAARVSPSAPLRNPLTACELQTHGSVDAGEGDAPPVSAGFRFASGRSVAISEEARERAKRLLQFDSGLTGAAAAEGAVNGMQEARQPVDAGEGDAPPVSAGFRFASGRSVAISEEARERAKRLLQFDSSEGGGVGGSGLDGEHAAGHAREFKWMGAGGVVSQIDKLVDELACFFESPRPALSLGVGGAAAAGGDDAGAEVAGCSRRDAETREPASVDSPHNLSPPPAVSLTVPSVASCPSLPVAASSEACLGSSAELATSSDSPVACRGSPASSAPACNNESVSCSSSSASSSPPSYVSPSSSCLHAPPPRLLRRRGPASGLLVRVAEAGAGGGRSGASPRDRRQFKAPRRNAQRAAPGGKHVAQARQSGAEVENAQGARPGDSPPKATPQHEQEDENGSLAGTANDICVSKGLEPASSLMAFSEGPRSSPSGLSSPAVPSSSSRSRLLCADSSFCANRLLLRWLWGQHARSITVVVPCALRALFASSSFVPLSALRSSLSGSRPPHSHTASLSSAPASPRSSLLPRKSSSGLRRGVADFAFFFIQQGGWLLCLPEALRRSVDPLRCASLDASRAFVVFSCEAPAHAAGTTGDVPAADSSKARGDGDEEEGLLRVAGADECYCMVQTYLQASREAKRQGSSLPSLLSAALARAAPSSLLASLSLLPNCGAGDARAASSDSKAQQRRGLSQTESGRFTRAWVRHHYALLSLYASQRWLQRCARAMADSRSDPEGVARQTSRPASPSSVFAPGSPPPRPPSPLSLLRALLRRVDEEANGRSSILRQVCEGDLSPATPMILEVLQVSFPGSSVSSCRAPLPPSSAPDENLALLVSDGRYVIRAKVADSFLAFYLARVFRGRGRDARGLFAAHAGDRNGRATREFPRLKFHRIFVQGASLAGLSEPCCPLELPASACLVLHASTCRPLFSPARRYFPFLSLACVTSSPSVLCPPWLMSREPLFRGVSASAPALLSAASAASSSASLLLNSPFSLSPAASAGLLLRAAYPLGRWRGGRGEEGEARGGHGEQEARPKRRHAEEEERGVPHALKALRRGMTGEVSVADVVILRKGPLLYRVWRDRRQESCSAPARPEASGKRRGTEEKDAEDAADGSESSGGREVVVMTESEFSAWKQRQEDVLGRRRQEEWECLRERIDALRMKLDERRQRKKARSEVCAARRREEQAGLVGGVANGIQPVREGSHSVACAAAPVSRMISRESERSTQAEEPEDDAKDEDEEELRDLERQERRLADAWSADRQGVSNQGKAQIEFLVLDTLFLLKLSALALQSSFSARGSPSLDSSPAAPGSSAPSPPSSVLSLSAHGVQGPAVSPSAASVEKRPLSSPFDAASLVPAAVSSYLSPESASSRPQSSSPFGSSSSAAFSAFDGSAAASASFSPCIPVDSSAPAFFVSQRDIESALESAVEAEDATKQDVQVAAGGAAAGRSAAPLEAGGQADFEASRDSADAPLPLLGPLPQRAPAGEGAGSPAAARCVFPASGAAAAEPLAQLFLQSLAVLTLYASGAEDEQETALRDLEEGERVKLSNLSCASGAQARGGLQSARSPGDLVAAAEDEEKRWRATWLGNARFRLLRMYGTNRTVCQVVRLAPSRSAASSSSSSFLPPSSPLSRRRSCSFSDSLPVCSVAPGSSRPLPFALPLSMLANACREELHLLQLSRASSAFSASNSLAAPPMQASGCSPLRAATPHSLPPPSVRGCSPVSSHASLLESRKQASAEDEDIEEENGKPEKSEATEDAGNRSQRGRHGASRTGVASPQVVKNEGEEERRRRQPVRQTRGRKSAVSQSSSGDASLKDNARKRCREEGGRDTEEMIQGLAAASTEEKREEGRAKEQEDEGKGAKELMKTAAGSARDCIEEEGCLNKVGSRPSFGKAGDATTALKTPKENNAKRALSSLARRCLAWTPAPVCLGLFRLPLFSQAHRLALLLNSEQSAFESRERGDEALARQAKSVREAGRQRQLDACEGQDSSAARRGERQEQSGGVHSAANEPLERGDGMPAEGEAASWRAWVAVGGRCIPPLEPSGVVPGMMYDLVGVLILLEAHQPPSMPASASLLASGGSRGSALLSGVVAFLWTSAGCLCRARIRPARGAWRNAPAHRLTASAPALEEAGEDEGIREGGGEGCSVLLRYRQILLGADLCRRREAGGVRAGRRHGDATGLPGAHTEEDGLRRWWLVQAGDSEDEREATPASDERSPSGRLSSSGAPSSGPPGSGAAAARARAPSVSDSLRWAVFQNVEFESHDAALGIFNFSASPRLLHVASGPISLPFLSRAPFSSSSPAHRSAWKASLRTAEVRGQRRAGESGTQADVGGPTAKKPERRPRQNAEASARKQAENDASKGAGEASEDAENEQASSLSGATKREESARRPGTQSCGNRSRHLQKNATCATEAPRENAEKGTEDAAERPGDGGDGKKRCLELSEGITTKQHPSLARARLDRDSLPLWWKDGACFSDKRFAEKTKSFEFIRDEIRELLCTFGDSRLNQPGEGGYEEAPKKRKLAEARDREETEVCGETEGQRNSLSGAQAAFRALQSARARVAVAVGAGKQAFFVSEF